MCGLMMQHRSFLTCFVRAFVLLVGLAGGKGGKSEEAFKQGDVGYSDTIGFATYGKVESETLTELLDRKGGVPQEGTNLLADLIKNWRHRSVIKQLAKLGIDPTDLVRITPRNARIYSRGAVLLFRGGACGA